MGRLFLSLSGVAVREGFAKVASQATVFFADFYNHKF
jgi:hypothetical protein